MRVAWSNSVSLAEFAAQVAKGGQLAGLEGTFREDDR